MIKKLFSLLHSVKETDLEEILNMEQDLKKDERFKETCRINQYNLHVAQEVYSAYVALKEYVKLKEKIGTENGIKKIYT